MLNNRKIKLKIKEKEVIQKHITTDFIRLDGRDDAAVLPVLEQHSGDVSD